MLAAEHAMTGTAREDPMHSYWALSALAAQRREALTAEADTARLIRQTRQGRHYDSTRSVRRMRRWTRGFRRFMTARPAEAGG
jgi:hypothetical protein